jgi:hypothetical protein
VDEERPGSQLFLVPFKLPISLRIRRLKYLAKERLYVDIEFYEKGTRDIKILVNRLSMRIKEGYLLPLKKKCRKCSGK